MLRVILLPLLPMRAVLLALGLTLLATAAPVRAQDHDAQGEALNKPFGPPCLHRNGDQGGPGAQQVAGSGENDLSVPLTPVLANWRERYLAARCQAAGGHFAEAEAGFREGLAAPQAFPLLWRWALVGTLVAAGRHEDAAGELGTLLGAEPGAILTDRSRALLHRLTVTPGDAPPALQAIYLDTYLERVPPTAEDYDLLLRRWELYGAEGPGEPRAALALQLWRNPRDERSAERWAAAARPGAAGGPAFSAEDRLARTNRLFALRLFDLAAREVEEEYLAAGDDRTAKALGRLYFRSLIRGRALQHAAVQINTPSLVRRFAFDRRQQLIWAIRIQLRRRHIGDVLKYLQELEALDPREGELPAIFLELLKYNLGRRDEVTSLHWLERITAEYGATPEASEAYWSTIWDAIKGKRYGRASDFLEMALRNSGTFHPVDQARLVYWKGRVQILQGQEAAGHATWEAMTARWPYSYYTALAEWNRNGTPLSLSHARNGSELKPQSAPVIEKLWEQAPFPQALFLFSVGEGDLAVELLRDAVVQKLSPEALEEAGALFHHLEGHYLQLRLVDNHHLEALRTSEVSDTPLWRRAYPRPHWEVVRRQADEIGIDPYFVLAIMREESRFFTFADSTAGAKGLMQLMPSTARMVAERNKLPYRENALHLPEMNIPLGTRYLNRVYRRFKGNPIYAAAAYNAGPTAVSRWVSQFGLLPLDEFVERIPFGETQRYVKRVFLSYVVYTKLYR